MKHLKNLDIFDVSSGNYSMVEKEGLYEIIHQHFATYGTTIVSASSKEEAMKKLNDYLATKPDGIYTALPCKDIENVFKLEVLE